MPKGKIVLLKVEGKFVEIMWYVSPEFKEYVKYEKGRKVLYMKLIKALYICM